MSSRQAGLRTYWQPASIWYCIRSLTLFDIMDAFEYAHTIVHMTLCWACAICFEETSHVGSCAPSGACSKVSNFVPYKVVLGHRKLPQLTKSWRHMTNIWNAQEHSHTDLLHVSSCHVPTVLNCNFCLLFGQPKWTFVNNSEKCVGASIAPLCDCEDISAVFLSFFFGGGTDTYLMIMVGSHAPTAQKDLYCPARKYPVP